MDPDDDGAGPDYFRVTAKRVQRKHLDGTLAERKDYHARAYRHLRQRIRRELFAGLAPRISKSLAGKFLSGLDWHVKKRPVRRAVIDLRLERELEPFQKDLRLLKHASAIVQSLERDGTPDHLLLVKAKQLLRALRQMLNHPDIAIEAIDREFKERQQRRRDAVRTVTGGPQGAKYLQDAIAVRAYDWIEKTLSQLAAKHGKVKDPTATQVAEMTAAYVNVACRHCFSSDLEPEPVRKMVQKKRRKSATPK